MMISILNGHLSGRDPVSAQYFRRKLRCSFLIDNHPALIDDLHQSQLFTDATAAAIKAAVEEFRKTWQPEELDYGTDF